MNQADIDAINERSEEQGHRLRLEQGCLDEYWNDDLLIPDAEKSYAEEVRVTELLVRSKLQIVADALNGHIIYQTVVNQDGTSYKRIIIEYEIKHD